MIIYFTMTLGVALIELMHVGRAKYSTFNQWASNRWDNLAVSFGSGVALCVVFPDFTLFLEDYFGLGIELHDYPSLGGLIFGLSSTPLINKIKALTKSTADKIVKGEEG